MSGARRLRHAARLLTGDDAQTEDLLQTALVRTYLRWDRIQADDPVGYVRQVLYTVHTDRWRRRWRHEYVAAELPDRPAPGDHAVEPRSRTLPRSQTSRCPVVTNGTRRAVLLGTLPDRLAALTG